MQSRQERASAKSSAPTTDFESLVGPWVSEMYRLAAAIVGVDGADDVVQDSLLDAWRGLPRLRDRSKVRSWLHAIVANRASKHLRAARSRPRYISVSPLDRPSDRSDPASTLAERDRLDRAFASLPADQRICVVLHYAFDLSVPQIAGTLSIAEGTVKSRIHAGVGRMRSALEESDD